MSLRICLGSGQKPYSGFTNVDIQPKWNPDVVADGANMPMFADDSAELIVCEHVLEHVELSRSDLWLKECYRILKPGGSLLIFVPDLYELTRAWMDGRINDYIFCVNLYGAYQGNEADFHRWAHTYKTLADKLRAAAQWSEVKPFDWEPIEGMAASRDWWILSIRAVK